MRLKGIQAQVQEHRVATARVSTERAAILKKAKERGKVPAAPLRTPFESAPPAESPAARAEAAPDRPVSSPPRSGTSVSASTRLLERKKEKKGE